jgi:hypothetical protein
VIQVASGQIDQVDRDNDEDGHRERVNYFGPQRSLFVLKRIVGVNNTFDGIVPGQTHDKGARTRDHKDGIDLHLHTRYLLLVINKSR